MWRFLWDCEGVRSLLLLSRIRGLRTYLEVDGLGEAAGAVFAFLTRHRQYNRTGRRERGNSRRGARRCGIGGVPRGCSAGETPWCIRRSHSRISSALSCYGAARSATEHLVRPVVLKLPLLLGIPGSSSPPASSWPAAWAPPVPTGRSSRASPPAPGRCRRWPC